jgi:hypothetical protein
MSGALLVTYAGFGLSAVIVARVNRHRPAMLLAYVASTFTVLAVVGLVLEILIVQNGHSDSAPAVLRRLHHTPFQSAQAFCSCR